MVDIVRILGERPFPMKESLKEYLVELKERADHEKDEEGQKKAHEGDAPSPTGTTATGEASSEDLKHGKVAQHGSNIPTP